MPTQTSPMTYPQPRRGLIRAHGLAALAMVVYSALLGFAIGLKFHWPDFLGDTSWLTWGRLRYGHTQGIFFGWLGNAFLAFFYHAVPRLAGRPVTSRALGWLLFVVWNFLVVIPGWVLVQVGVSQPLEWAEFPIVVDVFVVLAFVLMAIQFVLPFFRRSVSDLYVSAWYIIGGTVFTLFAYPVGNFVPELVPGAQGATYSGLWIHDAVGLYVTPFAVAILYFVIPTVTGRPIYSHFLSMLTFWMLFFIYPLNGTHHYIFSSIPMEAQVGAIVASVYLGMDVVLNVTNLLLSLKGSAGVVARDVPLRFVWVSIVTYLAVSLQGSMQALMPVNRLVHFTDWVIGHSHFAMIGFASFAAIGGLLHVWKRTAGLRYNAGAANWAFWLLAVGLFLMVTDLTVAGMVQGQLWQSETLWIESVSASRPYWITRSLAGLPVLAGFGALCLAMLTGPVGQDVPSTAAPGTSADGETLASDQVLQEIAEQSPPRPAVAQECLRADRRGGLRLLPVLVRRAGGLAEPDAGGRDRRQPPDGPAAAERERAARPCHLRPRGLPELPLPARPGHRQRRAPLRPAEPGVGDGEGVPAIVGHAPHRSRPGPRVRQALARLAPDPPVEPALGRARVQHAGPPVAVRRLPARADSGGARPCRLPGLPRPGRTPGRHAAAQLFPENGPGRGAAHGHLL